MQRIKYIQYGNYGTFNHVLQYKMIDKELSIITRSEGPHIKDENDPFINRIESKNKIRFAIKVGKYLNREEKNIIVYYAGCMLIPLINRCKKNTILDIRTFSIDEKAFTKFLKDILINIESIFYGKIFILSKGMKERLWRINRKKSLIVPLGAEPPEYYDKNLAKVKKENIIIYVGTFNQRNISEIVNAFNLFKANDSSNWVLEIIGRGSNEEVNKIIKNITTSPYKEYIKFYGEIRYPKLAQYLAKAKIGISYIPIDNRYDIQPSTKTLEYISAGCLVIGSDTTEQREIIKNNFGILIKNSREELANAIKELSKISQDRDKIEEFKKEHSWRQIYNMINNA